MAAVAIGKGRFAGVPVKQVTKSNFAAAIQQIKADIEAAEFVAISTRKTGDFSSSSLRHPWRRVLPIDTSETAYLKSKLAAETFELFQFAVCPFSIRGSKVVAIPYNFHLFPRDELTLGMPSYSFACQTSFLASMAREGFDFNACIYDGLSYLSRVEETKARERKSGSWMLTVTSSQNPSVADSIFKERIKSRVTHWRKACKDTSQAKDGSLVQSLRKLVLGGEFYGSRPGMSVDICSEKQAQLVFEIVEQISDDLVPILIPDNGVQPKAVRVVLTSSEEDKMVLLTELQSFEDEQNLKFRGFRQVIDLISSSHKTIVSHNCLHDFTFIHEKFLGPLPETVAEFMCSLRLLFSNVVDLNHLLKEFGPLRKAKNIPSALSYLKRHYFVPIELEVPEQAEDGNKSHGNNVLKLVFLFAKLNMLLKNAPSSRSALEQAKPIEDYANIFNPASLTLHEPGDDDETGWQIDSTRRVSTDKILFLWGFGGATSAVELKHCLLQIHPVFVEDFDVRFVDKTCAVIVFETLGSAETLLKDMHSVDTVSGVLRDMVVEGLRAAGYEAYKKVCRLGLWEGDLADSLEIALAETVEDLCSLSKTDTNENRWKNEMMIDLNDL
ncbi:poly(A)-specific ribonuclease PARN-like [Dendrobium catenatum]|uniref:Poly(A)-specific ribonuclease PARN-like n=1 Tax=Dendrobium catenatum TaxID=906689 RepID=A0A2I0XCJ1_9ASPA|nr:poly(A)-specific ribonuclease PARN-like [Dendrobium catenatum]XP_020681651.1 poly(A)-specific ribonuclease PARN-like [Dendrobium catenatum]PKU85625.1 Poly(A)-specific ribonuclease PARN-like [Dendrobium catenatum]